MSALKGIRNIFDMAPLLLGYLLTCLGHIRDVTARYEEGIGALSARGIDSQQGSTASENPRTSPVPESEPANVAQTVPTEVEDLIASQRKEISDLRSVVRNFSETLRAQAATQATEYDRLAAQYDAFILTESPSVDSAGWEEIL